MIFAMLAATLAATALPQGGRLQPIDQCFAIVRPGPGGEVVIGATRQIVRRMRIEGRPAWDVVVHQRVPVANFAMRDHFVLNRVDLTPIALDSQRNGVPHVALRYKPGHVSGTRTEKGIVTPVELDTPVPVWDGNLWGVTFGTLPLAAGKRFSLPFYQYDSGLGSFTLTVTGSESVMTPTGAVDAWTVDVVKDGRPVMTALIAKRDGRELGSHSARGGMKLGGDCSGLE